MPDTADVVHFARLIETLHPWLDQVAIIGGWRTGFTGYTRWPSRSITSRWEPWIPMWLFRPNFL
jgi:hypothetical protein